MTQKDFLTLILGRDPGEIIKDSMYEFNITYYGHPLRIHTWSMWEGRGYRYHALVFNPENLDWIYPDADFRNRMSILRQELDCKIDYTGDHISISCTKEPWENFVP